MWCKFPFCSTDQLAGCFKIVSQKCIPFVTKWPIMERVYFVRDLNFLQYSIIVLKYGWCCDRFSVIFLWRSGCFDQKAMYCHLRFHQQQWRIICIIHLAYDPCRAGSVNMFNNVKRTVQFSTKESGLDSEHGTKQNFVPSVCALSFGKMHLS